MAASLRSQACLSRSFVKCFILKETKNSTSFRLASVPHKCLHSSVTRQLTSLQQSHRLRLLSRHARCQNWCAVLPLLPVRNASSASDLPTGYIPDVPSVPVEDITDLLPELNALGEPCLTSLGLGSNFPPGLFQKALEMIHVGLDIPWWGSICIAVICIRTCIFPLMVKQRRHTVNLGNHLPTITRLQQRITGAKATGNYLEVSKKSGEIQEYMKRHNVKLAGFLMPLVQVPIFFSVFMGLRKMTELPVESMTTGGTFWFTNLTVADPFYILPIVTSVTLLAIVEFGAESNKASSMSHAQKWLMRGMPVFVLVFTCNFPAAMAVYWAANNMFSLIQSQVLKIEVVRIALKIPEAVNHPKDDAMKKKGFIEGFRESINNNKMIKEASERRYIEELDFKKAGTGPVPKTYAYDPTLNKKKIKQVMK